jgi:hypothetical protein
MKTGTYLLQHIFTDKKYWNSEVVIIHDVEFGVERKKCKHFHLI